MRQREREEGCEIKKKKLNECSLARSLDVHSLGSPEQLLHIASFSFLDRNDVEPVGEPRRNRRPLLCIGRCLKGKRAADQRGKTEIRRQKKKETEKERDSEREREMEEDENEDQFLENK